LTETFDLNSGGHTQLALASGEALTSLGKGKMTGSGATTFVLDAIYGADVITNFNGADTVSLPTSEFTHLRAGSGHLDRFPRTISGVLPGLLSLPHRGWDGGRA